MPVIKGNKKVHFPLEPQLGACHTVYMMEVRDMSKQGKSQTFRVKGLYMGTPFTGVAYYCSLYANGWQVIFSEPVNHYGSERDGCFLSFAEIEHYDNRSVEVVEELGALTYSEAKQAAGVS